MDDPRFIEISEGLRGGRLEGISFPELLMALCGTGSTGVLCLATRGHKKNIYIESGRVIFAASENPDDRLGILLLRQNAVTLHQLETAIKSERAGVRLGTLLVEADSITPDQLGRAVIDQVKSIVLDLFTVGEAEYRFTEGPLPTSEVITLDLPVNALVLEGIKRTKSLHRIRQGIGGPTTVWGLNQAWKDAIEGLALSEGERLLVERLKQGEASIDELCDEVFLSNFEICQFLWALKVMGAIEELGFRSDPSGDVGFRDAGEDQGFLEFLLQLCRARETGVLYATLGARERSFHLSEGECVFATSNHPEDGLVNFLLRRGVISLRDREDTSHRLLSNKRVGTILLELGVIDDDDLCDMVRQQLVEVVYDTFRWDAGEFSFVCGPLPSIEPITLTTSLESLVAAGLRRVTSWRRIRRGCGGLRSILGLTPNYLDVLDAMGSGVEEWEVVNALRTPRSPLEVCQLTSLGNFRVCQILWAMKILGGIEVIQPEEAEAWEDPSASFFAGSRDGAAEFPEPLLDEIPIDVPDPSAVDAPDDVQDEAVRTKFPATVLDEIAGPIGADDRAVTLIPVESESTDAIERVVSVHAEAEFEPVRFLDVDDRDREGAESPRPESAAADVVAPMQAAPQEDELVASSLPIRDQEPAAGSPDFEVHFHAEPPDIDEIEALVDEPEWDPPADLDASIARFNAMQRVIYRTVRSEVGAGAANFIRSCCEEGPQAVAVSGTELHTDGSWDAGGLRNAVIEQRIEDPWFEYRRLIHREIEILQGHIGEARAQELLFQVERAVSGLNL